MATTKKRSTAKPTQHRKPARRRPATPRKTLHRFYSAEIAEDIAAATTAAAIHGFREGLATAAASASIPATAIAEPALPVKILADGTRCPAGDPRTDHVAVLFPDGTMIHPTTLGTPEGDYLPSWQACDDACRALRVLDHDDWQLASRQDWERYVLDLTRHQPAVDTNLFPGIKPNWHWTSTPAAWSSASAWGVGASLGYVSSYNRHYGGFALAVRRAGQ